MLRCPGSSLRKGDDDYDMTATAMVMATMVMVDDLVTLPDWRKSSKIRYKSSDEHGSHPLSLPQLPSPTNRANTAISSIANSTINSTTLPLAPAQKHIARCAQLAHQHCQQQQEQRPPCLLMVRDGAQMLTTDNYMYFYDLTFCLSFICCEYESF